MRSPRTAPECVQEQVDVGDIGGKTSWDSALQSVDCVMHLAARAHILGDDPHNSNLYMETNARGTLRLAEAAAAAGVGRLVYLSSVKVNGEATEASPFAPGDRPAPQDAYGVSKWHAEQSLQEVARRTGLGVAIVRPPLVYGPGVGANFLRLIRWVDRGWPLPFGRVRNSRSLISLWNLCDMLTGLPKNPQAYGRTWMVCDGQDLSTPQLVRRIGTALRRPVRLLPVPVGLLRVAAATVGRSAEFARLCGSLTVNMTSTCSALGWTPPVSVDEALARTAAWYVEKVRGVQE